MADIALVVDPSGTSLTLHNRAGGLWIAAFDAGNPDPQTQWASSADTEGALVANTQPANRTVTATLIMQAATDAALQALENTVDGKMAKLNREGGELQLTTPAATTITFDVLQAVVRREWTPEGAARHRTARALEFTCKPYGRAAEVDLGDNVETTLPVLVFTEATVAGDVPALGRLVIDEDQAVSQWWMTWGIESKNYSSSANAALYYEAEGRTALGGSAIAAGPSGASGAGSNVMRNTALPVDYLAILSTQATAAGAHLSHVGSFHVYAKVQVPTANTGLVTVALEWAEADFLRYSRNAATTIPAEHEGQWRLVDLGLVTTTKVLSGTQRWEGRIVAKSTVSGDDIDIDYLMLVPVLEGSGIASGVVRSFTPTTYVGDDAFTGTTAAAVLNARVAPTGGTWATSGDATDFAFADITYLGGATGESVTRSTISGTNGRFAVLGSTNYGSVQVEATTTQDNAVDPGQPYVQLGVIARWVDASNHLRAVIYRDSQLGFTGLEIHELLGGVKTVIASQSIANSAIPIVVGGYYGQIFMVRLVVDATGRATAQMLGTDTAMLGFPCGKVPAGTVLLEASAARPSLASGGTLATGKPGLFDLNVSTTASITRGYDAFHVSAPPADAAAFASQSIEIRSDRVLREDSGGTMWAKLGSYTGDYLLVPPSGAEARTSRVIVKMSRSDPFELDPSIDDLSAKLFVTPRYLHVPV